MNLFVLRLSWLGVKAAQLLLPAAWFVIKLFFWILVAMFVAIGVILIL